jgi:hypothetical protein
MRLKMQVMIGILMAFGLSALQAQTQEAAPREDSGKKPGMFSRMFHKDSSSKKDASKSEDKDHLKADNRKHTNGFPEKDKKGLAYQPQSTDDKWIDEAWKTSRNKDTFKKVDDK